MPMSGDWPRLQATIRGVQALGTVPSRMARPASVAIKGLIDNEFATNTDPYGKAWAPHKPATVKRWGAHDLLRLTGAGKAAITVTPAPGAGIAISSPSLGLAFAQGGTKFEVKRRTLPEDTMPKTWREALELAATATVKETLSGAQ